MDIADRIELAKTLSHPKELNEAIDRADAFDERFGTETSAFAPSGVAEGFMYVATLETMFREIMAGIDIRHEDFTFVDFGSGKGRAVLLASSYPFRHCIGVEVTPELHAIAERNIAKYKNPEQRCANVGSMLVDARKFELPDDDLLLWFYNPFNEAVWRDVLDNIKRSLEKRPRRVLIVYAQQHLAAITDGCSWLRKVGPQGGPCTIPMVVGKDGRFPYNVYEASI
ncbi:MAG: class I SAM-dependent methyltransferase [Polyangiaceae bacterium]